MSNRSPVGLIVIDVSCPRPTGTAVLGSPVIASHERSVPSMDEVSSVSPSGRYAAAVTIDSCCSTWAHSPVATSITRASSYQFATTRVPSGLNCSETG